MIRERVLKRLLELNRLRSAGKIDFFEFEDHCLLAIRHLGLRFLWREMRRLHASGKVSDFMLQLPLDLPQANIDALFRKKLRPEVFNYIVARLQPVRIKIKPESPQLLRPKPGQVYVPNIEDEPLDLYPAAKAGDTDSSTHREQRERSLAYLDYVTEPYETYLMEGHKVIHNTYFEIREELRRLWSLASEKKEAAIAKLKAQFEAKEISEEVFNRKLTVASKMDVAAEYLALLPNPRRQWSLEQIDIHAENLCISNLKPGQPEPVSRFFLSLPAKGNDIHPKDIAPYLGQILAQMDGIYTIVEKQLAGQTKRVLTITEDMKLRETDKLALEDTARINNLQFFTMPGSPVAEYLEEYTGMYVDRDKQKNVGPLFYGSKLGLDVREHARRFAETLAFLAMDQVWYLYRQKGEYKDRIIQKEKWDFAKFIDAPTIHYGLPLDYSYQQVHTALSTARDVMVMKMTRKDDLQIPTREATAAIEKMLALDGFPKDVPEMYQQLFAIVLDIFPHHEEAWIEFATAFISIYSGAAQASRSRRKKIEKLYADIQWNERQKTVAMEQYAEVSMVLPRTPEVDLRRDEVDALIAELDKEHRTLLDDYARYAVMINKSSTKDAKSFLAPDPAKRHADGSDSFDDIEDALFRDIKIMVANAFTQTDADGKPGTGERAYASGRMLEELLTSYRFRSEEMKHFGTGEVAEENKLLAAFPKVVTWTQDLGKRVDKIRHDTIRHIFGRYLESLADIMSWKDPRVIRYDKNGRRAGDDSIQNSMLQLSLLDAAILRNREAADSALAEIEKVKPLAEQLAQAAAGKLELTAEQRTDITGKMEEADVDHHLNVVREYSKLLSARAKLWIDIQKALSASTNEQLADRMIIRNLQRNALREMMASGDDLILFKRIQLMLAVAAETNSTISKLIKDIEAKQAEVSKAQAIVNAKKPKEPTFYELYEAILRDGPAGDKKLAQAFEVLDTLSSGGQPVTGHVGDEAPDFIGPVLPQDLADTIGLKHLKAELDGLMAEALAFYNLYSTKNLAPTFMRSEQIVDALTKLRDSRVIETVMAFEYEQRGEKPSDALMAQAKERLEQMIEIGAQWQKAEKTKPPSDAGATIVSMIAPIFGSYGISAGLQRVHYTEDHGTGEKRKQYIVYGWHLYEVLKRRGIFEQIPFSGPRLKPMTDEHLRAALIQAVTMEDLNELLMLARSAYYDAAIDIRLKAAGSADKVARRELTSQGQFAMHVDDEEVPEGTEEDEINSMIGAIS